MPQKRIRPRCIKGLIIQHTIHGDSAALIARSFKIARSTVRVYIDLYNNSDLVHTDISNLSADSIATSIRPQNCVYKSAKYIALRDLYYQYHQRLKNEDTNMKSLWREYTQHEPSGLKYSDLSNTIMRGLRKSGYLKSIITNGKLEIFPRRMKRH